MHFTFRANGMDIAWIALGKRVIQLRPRGIRPYCAVPDGKVGVLFTVTSRNIHDGIRLGDIEYVCQRIEILALVSGDSHRRIP